MIEIIETIREFTESGGIVLQAIGVLIFVMWVLILERVAYIHVTHKKLKADVIEQWMQRKERSSWNAEQIRQAIISRVTMQLRGSIPIVQALVALCPLLGLMGTVTGMIEVFEVMALSGGGNARSMAAGVSKATIPTMAGMVGALSGVFASAWLMRTSKAERTHLEDALPLDRNIG